MAQRTTFSPLSNNLESLKWRDILGKVSQAIVGSSWSYATCWGLKVALKDLLEIRKSLTWLSKMSKIQLFDSSWFYRENGNFFPRWKKWIERSRSWVSFDDVTGLTDGLYRCVIWAQYMKDQPRQWIQFQVPTFFVYQSTFLFYALRWSGCWLGIYFYNFHHACFHTTTLDIPERKK